MCVVYQSTTCAGDVMKLNLSCCYATGHLGSVRMYTPLSVCVHYGPAFVWLFSNFVRALYSYGASVCVPMCEYTLPCFKWCKPYKGITWHMVLEPEVWSFGLFLSELYTCNLWPNQPVARCVLYYRVVPAYSCVCVWLGAYKVSW